MARAVPILPAKFLEKYNDKSKEQNAGKITSEILEKWMLKDWNLDGKNQNTLKEQLQTALDQFMLLGNILKNRDTLKSGHDVIKYSYRTVTHV